MDLSYVLTPCLAWVAAGSLKFFINSVKVKRLAFDLIGYGGLPSTHSTLVSSMAAIIALKNGVEHRAFGVASTLAIVVMLDANSLRRQALRVEVITNRDIGLAALAGGFIDADRANTHMTFLGTRPTHMMIDHASKRLVVVLVIARHPANPGRRGVACV